MGCVLIILALWTLFLVFLICFDQTPVHLEADKAVRELDLADQYILLQPPAPEHQILEYLQCVEQTAYHKDIA